MVKELEEMSRDELEELRANVDRALADVEERRRNTARAAVEATAAEHGFTLAELYDLPAPKRRATRGRARTKGEAKYRNPDDPSQTWPGKGRKPQWIKDAEAAGRSLDDFLI